MQNYYSLTDGQYSLIEDILRDDRDRRGRKPKISDRHALEGALYVLCTGCPWRAMPEVFGSWMMVFMRYKRWVERGVWWKVLMRLQGARVLDVRVSAPSEPSDSALLRTALGQGRMPEWTPSQH